MAQTSVDAPTATPGGNVRLRVFTLFDRSYATFVSSNTAYRRNLLGLGLAGRGLLDVAAPLATPLIVGRTTGGSAAIWNFTVPVLPSLSGLQLTLQSATGAPNGVADTLSFPSLLVITP